MAEQQSLIDLTALTRTSNQTWTFRLDLGSEHAPFVERFMHNLAKSGIVRGGWFTGNWWFEDDAMELLKYLFSNWEEMKAQALAVESRERRLEEEHAHSNLPSVP